MSLQVKLNQGKWYCGEFLIPEEELFSGKYKIVSMKNGVIVLSIKRIPKKWKEFAEENTTEDDLEPEPVFSKRRSNIVDPNRKIQFIDDRTIESTPADKKIAKKLYIKKPVPRVRPVAKSVKKTCCVCGRTEEISASLASIMLDTSYRCSKCFRA